MIMVTVVIGSAMGLEREREREDDDVREILAVNPTRSLHWVLDKSFRGLGEWKKSQDVRLSWNLLYRASLSESAL